MADQASRDQNFVPTLLATSSVDGVSTIKLYADPITHRLLVDSIGNTGTVSSVSIVSTNGFAGTVATPTTTPAVTISTTVTGLLQGNGTALSAVTIGSGLSFTGGTLSATAGGIVVGTTSVTGGTTTRVLYDNAGVVGEYSISGSGSVAMTNNPVLVTPVLGAATATSINGLILTASTGTFTLTNAKTFSVTNTLTLSGTDGSTLNIGTGGTLGTAAYTSSSVYGLLANPLSQFAATTSAQLAGVLTDETGTGVAVFGTAPTLTNPIVGTQATSDNSTKAASTAYVTTAINNAIAGVNPAVAVKYATTAAGDTSGLTYNNGVSGVGATMTGANNTAVTIDGHTFVVGDVNLTRILIKNDTQSPSGAFNGVYLFTALQTVGTGAIFTRALDYDMPSDINSTGAIPVVSGTTNTDTSWLLTSNVTTVGTDPLTYVQFSINPTTVQTNTLTNTHVWVGNASNVATDVAVSGDLTLANTGATTLATVNSNVGSFTNANITVNAKGLITAASNGTGGVGITWNEVTTTSQTAAINNGYLTNNASLVTVTLPSTAALGSIVEVAGKGAGGWKIAQNASGQIHFGSSNTTSGTGGSLASTNQYDAMRLVCSVANNEWVVLSSIGNITVV